MSKESPQPDNNFFAVYNPYLRRLKVYYGGVWHERWFEDAEEWTIIDHKGKPECYLHVQLDFDEYCQLIFYPRVDDSDSLNEHLVRSWHDGEGCGHCDNNIVIAHTSQKFDEALTNFMYKIDLNENITY